MPHLINALRDARAKRARYNQILSELQSMSRRASLDLGIYPEDAPRIAHKAVYGR